jgi:AcrR family transcriptional regulator
VVQAVADKGYSGATVADIVSRAGVSRKTFYEHFRDKEDCFLAAYDEGVEILMAHIRAAGEGTENWQELIRARAKAYLTRLVEEPAFARAYLIEVFAAGDAALARRRAVHARLAKFGRELNESARTEYPEMPEVPDEVIVAAFGAINEMLSTYVGEGRTSELLELQGPIEYVQTALFAGRRPWDADS